MRTKRKPGQLVRDIQQKRVRPSVTVPLLPDEDNLLDLVAKKMKTSRADAMRYGLQLAAKEQSV